MRATRRFRFGATGGRPTRHTSRNYAPARRPTASPSARRQPRGSERSAKAGTLHVFRAADGLRDRTRRPRASHELMRDPNCASRRRTTQRQTRSVARRAFHASWRSRTRKAAASAAKRCIELLQRTYRGYLTHPNVAAALLLEHGCEKIPNDVMRRQLDPPECRSNQFGWASVQLDGGIEKALAKIEGWFDDEIRDAAPGASPRPPTSAHSRSAS